MSWIADHVTRILVESSAVRVWSDLKLALGGHRSLLLLECRLRVDRGKNEVGVVQLSIKPQARLVGFVATATGGSRKRDSGTYY